MSSISIKKPIALNMDVVEIDEHLPSIKMTVELNIEHPTGKIFYQANDIWFDCGEWDDFALALKQLFKSNNSSASLENLSDNLKIIFTKDNNIIRLDFTVQENNSSGGIASIKFSSTIDDDLFAPIKNQFVEFEGWW